MAITPDKTVEALIRKVGGDVQPTPGQKKLAVEKKIPKNYEHVKDESLYSPDDFNFLEAQRLAMLLTMKQKLEGTGQTQTSGQSAGMNGMPKMPGFTEMGNEIGKAGSSALQSINKQIGTVLQHFSENPNNAAFLRKFSETMPVITQMFGNYNPDMYSWGSHTGTDFGTKRGDAVSLPEGNWKIVDAYSGAGDGNVNDWTNKGYGNSVLAQNLNTGEKIRLSHLQDVAVKTGDTIQGGVIGSAGTSGHSTGVHTDVEYYDDKGKLGDITNNQYITSIFKEPKKVLQTPDKRMSEIQNKVTSFQKVLQPSVQASQNTMKPAVIKPQVQSIQKPVVNNPWTNPTPTYAKPQASNPVYGPAKPQVQAKPVVQPPKPIVTTPVKPKAQTSNLIQNAINAFSNLFKKK